MHKRKGKERKGKERKNKTIPLVKLAELTILKFQRPLAKVDTAAFSRWL